MDAKCLDLSISLANVASELPGKCRRFWIGFSRVYTFRDPEKGTQSVFGNLDNTGRMRTILAEFQLAASLYKQVYPDFLLYCDRGDPGEMEGRVHCETGLQVSMVYCARFLLWSLRYVLDKEGQVAQCEAEDIANRIDVFCVGDGLIPLENRVSFAGCNIPGIEDVSSNAVVCFPEKVERALCIKGYGEWCRAFFAHHKLTPKRLKKLRRVCQAEAMRVREHLREKLARKD